MFALAQIRARRTCGRGVFDGDDETPSVGVEVVEQRPARGDERPARTATLFSLGRQASCGGGDPVDGRNKPIACVGELAVLLLVPLCAGGGRLAAPLIWVNVILFVWSFAQLAALHSDWIGWHLLDMTAAALSIALAFHFCLRFLGRSRQLYRALRAAYAYQVLSAAATAAGLVWPPAQALAFSRMWSWAWLAGLFPATTGVTIMLIQHARQTENRDERKRARLLLVAVAVSAPLASTERQLAHCPAFRQAARFAPLRGALDRLVFALTPGCRCAAPDSAFRCARNWRSGASGIRKINYLVTFAGVVSCLFVSRQGGRSDARSCRKDAGRAALPRFRGRRHQILPPRPSSRECAPCAQCAAPRRPPDAAKPPRAFRSRRPMLPDHAVSSSSR